MDAKLDVAEVDRANREKFGDNVYYRVDNICNASPANSTAYFDVLSWRKHEIAVSYCRGGVVLDVCCGTGTCLFALDGYIKAGIGVDFTEGYVAAAAARARQLGNGRYAFYCASALRMPLPSGSVDLAYCFSSLYAIPDAGQVVREMSRLLRPGGYCILDFGNRFSLNTLVARAHPELARHYHLSIRDMCSIMSAAGLSPVERRSFQLLPLWTDTPRWLLPVLWEGWIKIMQKKIKGRMVDEWLSNLPGLRTIAFRQIFVCRKGQK